MDARLQPALTAGLIGALVTLVVTVPCVAVQYRRRGTVRAGRGRPRLALRWLLGIGGYLLLVASETTSGVALLLAVASVIAVLVTRGRRGLAFRVLGLDVRDERTSAPRGGTAPLDAALTTGGDPA